MKELKILSKRCQYICIIVLLLIISLNQVKITQSNPIILPIDSDYEGGPLISWSNNSVIFTQEVINVTFDSSQAYINAYYTFRNNKTMYTNISIMLPFSANTLINNLTMFHKENEIAYSWFDYEDAPLYNISGHLWKLVDSSICFNLSFASYEVKKIHVNYSRKYGIFRERTFWKYKRYYSYRYLIGTTRKWNRSLESAYFEFWVPKKLVDNGPGNYPDPMNVNETSDYIIGSVLYENWLPSQFDDFLEIYWGKNVQINILGNFFFLGSVPVLIIALIKLRNINTEDKEKLTTINHIKVGILILLIPAVLLALLILSDFYNVYFGEDVFRGVTRETEIYLKEIIMLQQRS